MRLARCVTGEGWCRPQGTRQRLRHARRQRLPQAHKEQESQDQYWRVLILHVILREAPFRLQPLVTRNERCSCFRQRRDTGRRDSGEQAARVVTCVTLSSPPLLRRTARAEAPRRCWRDLSPRNVAFEARRGRGTHPYAFRVALMRHVGCQPPTHIEIGRLIPPFEPLASPCTETLSSTA
jgi:hypothetical protein